MHNKLYDDYKSNANVQKQRLFGNETYCLISTYY